MVEQGDELLTVKTPRTDPRVLRTRQLIRDAFIDLLQEYDLEKITVNRIAARSTISRVTFYLHYRDIPDLMDKMADDMINEIHTILREVPEKPQVEVDWTILLRILEHIAENSKFYTVLLASKRVSVFTDRLMKLMVEIISKRAESRIASSTAPAVNVPNDIAIWYGSSAFIGTIVCWLRNDMPYTPLYLAKQLSLLFRLHQNPSHT
ncbi:TetR/AcrR family transcriptional regulator C-terminal domain-containing protein [Paenibacillus sp. DLE-14]|uniref:TetR/AcrR family transcriptional regulator C-terminal domain-containing protein n=1 Tax=Paenibacillus lignilyticus TaxID=1172615 RepID=A0ABS5C952_9BACL|nr:TetR/AcrR family transcriptional regulator C-terminal domain-containing protein [Paenibacillus lignilyticus]